jgi:hypothetical protein
MDVKDVEHIHFAALGGADKITINELSGTDVTQVDMIWRALPTLGMVRRIKSQSMVARAMMPSRLACRRCRGCARSQR